MRSFDKPTLTFLQTDSRGRVGERSTLGGKGFCVPESASEAIDLVHPGLGLMEAPDWSFRMPGWLEHGRTGRGRAPRGV